MEFLIRNLQTKYIITKYGKENSHQHTCILTSSVVYNGCHVLVIKRAEMVFVLTGLKWSSLCNTVKTTATLQLAFVSLFPDFPCVFEQR